MLNFYHDPEALLFTFYCQTCCILQMKNNEFHAKVKPFCTDVLKKCLLEYGHAIIKEQRIMAENL